MQIKRYKIRCAVDLAKRTIRDVKTGAYPIFPAGSDVQFEFAFFYDATLIDIQSWDSLKMDVVPASNIIAARLMERTIGKSPAPEAPAVEKLDSSLTKTTWDDLTKQHALVTFTAAETLYANPGANEASLALWMILRVTTSTSETFTVAADHAKSFKDGHSGTGAPEAGDTSYYTAAEIETLFVRKSALTLDFQAVKIWNPDQGKYQFIGLRGLADAEEVIVFDEI